MSINKQKTKPSSGNRFTALLIIVFTIAGTPVYSEGQPPASLGAAFSLQDAFHSVYERNKDSVVFISTERTVNTSRNHRMNDLRNQSSSEKEAALGTGFIISTDGYICTNHHVIASMEKVQVRIGKKVYNAKVIGSDAFTDIALLKVDNINGLIPVTLGNSNSVRIGDWAVAIGNPFGLDRTLTVGVISAIAREDVDRLGNSHLQSDVSINRGNSGGPLLNIKGEVIGVNRMIISPNGGNIGIGFSIPSNVALSIIEDLKSYGKVRRGYLGVQIVPLSEQQARDAGLNDNKGAFVESVQTGSPAEKSGLRNGDIIRSLNNTEVENPAQIVCLVSRQNSGSTLTAEVIRNKQKTEITIKLTERPQEKD